MTQTFGKEKRLLTPLQFACVFDEPIKKIHSEHLLLFVGHSNDNTTTARLGLAITKKKLKNATDRNHLKRLTRERFRKAWGSLAGVDVVLIVKRRFDKGVDIGAELDEIFSRLFGLYPADCTLDAHDKH